MVRLVSWKGFNIKQGFETPLVDKVLCAMQCEDPSRRSSYRESPPDNEGFEKPFGGLDRRVPCNSMRQWSYSGPLMARLISWKPSNIEERFENSSGRLNAVCNAIRHRGLLADSWLVSYRGSHRAYRKLEKVFMFIIDPYTIPHVFAAYETLNTFATT